MWKAFKSMVVVVAIGLGAVGCGGMEVAENQAGGEAVASEAVPPEEIGTSEQALTACHPGQVGDSRWLTVGCCSRTSRKQNLQRCDGRFWRSTVAYRCVASTSLCPM